MYKNFTKKIWLIMRLTTVILIATLMQVSAATFAQRITINEQMASLEGILKDIRTQSGYDFVFNRNFFVGTKPVNITVKNASLEEALDLALSGQPLTYSIQGKAVVIKLKRPSFLENVAAVFSNVNVRGRIIDEGGAPLPGALIKIKGKVIATASNTGEFSVDVAEGTILEISYVGYKTQEASVKKNMAVVTIILTPDISKLDEVTVEGYRKGSQRYNTGNISKISSEELMKQPVSNPLQALEGRIPGMVVNQVSGVPGARLNVQVRGRAKFDRFLTNDQPLFILDGVPLAAGNDKVNLVGGPFGSGIPDGLSAISGINAADIESIDVLKDADATAIYGSRGANGVILITTKKGKAGKMTLSANVFSGVSVVSRIPKMLNTEEYLGMRREALANDNITPTNSNAPDLRIWDQNRYTNFGELLVGNNAKTSDAQVTLSGGNKAAQYRIGAGYHKEGTVWPGDMSSDRISTSFNVHSMSENEKFNVDLSGVYTANKSNLIALDLANAISLPPNFMVYDQNGKLGWNEGGVSVIGKDNPLATLNNLYLSNMSNLNASLSLDYKVLKNLTVRSSFGYNATQNDEKRLTPISAQKPTTSTTGSASFGANQLKNWIIEPQAQYVTNISKGKLDVLLGGTYNKRNTSSILASGRGYATDEFIGTLAGATQSMITASNGATVYKYQAIFGRINYNWENTYILNFTGRRDGSSRFGPEYRFSNFGAIGAAWLFSNEKFLRDNKVLSYGKLRASYGVTGNDQIGEYTYLDQWTPSNSYTDSATLYPKRLFSPDLHWERNTKTEIGLELGFFNDRILLNTSVYQNISSDPLINYPLPRITGFNTVVNNLNGVEVQNRGVEITLTTVNTKKSSFIWTTDFNITIPKNKLKKYPNLAASSYATEFAIDEPLNRIFTAQYLGVDPTTGLYTVKDVNSDGRINTLDYSTIGSIDPKYYGGINNNFTYKRFSASFFLQFTKQLGRDWRTNNSTNPPGTMFNVPALVLDRWQVVGQETDVQKFTTVVPFTGTNGFYLHSLSSGAYTDASFIRLKNVYLAYNVPTNWLTAVHIKSCKFYVQGQNLFLITGYKAGDPEMQNYKVMAPLRTITGGLQLSL